VTDSQPNITEKDQFALEMDHMALCVKQNQQPHTPGEEGMQDIRIIEAIYESVLKKQPIAVSAPTASTRGTEPESV
jgi:predicted dehydrogenase